MAHEDITRDDVVQGSSDRAFGLVFAAVFLIVALYPLFSDAGVRWWAVVVAAAFGGLAVTVPRLLAPLNRFWMRIGLVLHRVVSPIALGIMFYGVILPTGLLMRLLGKNPLRLSFDSAAPSYWIERHPPGPPPASFKDQF